MCEYRKMVVELRLSVIRNDKEALSNACEEAATMIEKLLVEMHTKIQEEKDNASARIDYAVGMERSWQESNW